VAAGQIGYRLVNNIKLVGMDGKGGEAAYLPLTSIQVGVTRACAQ